MSLNKNKWGKAKQIRAAQEKVNAFFLLYLNLEAYSLELLISILLPEIEANI